MGPLEGLRALEIGDSGEVAGKLLADAGVDMIRVEPPSGARSRQTGPFVGDIPDVNTSLHYHYLNTSKRGITLNLDEPRAQILWRSLVDGVDLVIDSTGPDHLDQRKSGYQSFDGHQELVWCSITPFGRSGPFRDWEVTDIVSMALGGPPMSSGYDDHEIAPIRSDGEHSFAIAGVYAASAILAALWQRGSEGSGQLIDLSIHECISATTEGAFANWEYLQSIVQRQTGRHASVDLSAPTQHQCADGRYVLLLGGGIPRSRASWEPLLEWMDEHDAADDLHDPKYIDVIYTDPRSHPQERDHVADTVARFARKLTSEEVYRRGQSMRLPWGIVRRPEENLDDPHWSDRNFFVDGNVHGHEGVVRYPRAPYRFTSSPVGMRSRAPLLGEHNTEIFTKLGLQSDELTELAIAGVL